MAHKKSQKRKIEVYLDGVDWQHEIDAVHYGTKVYPTLEDAKNHLKCHKSCGIVKCVIENVDWVVKQDLFRKGSYVTVKGNTTYTKKQILRSRVSALKAHKKYVEKQVRNLEKRLIKLEKEYKNVKNQ